jgi:nucleotide-binding universal stress UspA family protein
MYKNILVAVDESNPSMLAVKEAIKFGQAFPDSFLKIVHIGDEFFINWDGAPVYPNDNEQSFKNSQLALLQNIEIELHAAKLQQFETRLIEAKSGSRVAEKIVEEAKSWPADLLILGTHGRRGFHHFLLGSVAEGVVRIATMPVLLIRGK